MVSGTAKNDKLHGTKKSDVIRGGAGGDVLKGLRGGDLLIGEQGDDRLLGGSGSDRLRGGEGNDRLDGGQGDDRLLGGDGADVLKGGPGNDRLNGGAGKDKISCGGGTDIVVAGTEDTVAADCEAVPAAEAKKTGKDNARSLSAEDVLLVALLVAVVLVALAGAAIFTRRLLGPPRLTSAEERPAPVSGWLPYTAPFPALGIVGIAIYSVSVDDASAFASALLIAAGAFLVGGLFGFLFGIPKSLATDPGTATTAAQARAFKPNTNLEDISDWLTKIIVGLTLVQFGQLVDRLQQFADFLAPSLGGEESSSAFAIAILLLFSISGFLTLYVAIRLYGREFSRAENAAAQAAAQLRESQPEIANKVDKFKASAGAGP